MNDDSRESRPARRMPNRPAWVTPPGQIPIRLTQSVLDAMPLGTVLSIPAGFRAVEGMKVYLSVEKVSTTRWRVHSRKGFDRAHLIGLYAIHRRPQENERP